MSTEETEQPSSSSTPAHLQTWIQIQDELKARLVTEDDFPWGEEGDPEAAARVRYVGGVDVSYSKDDPWIACGTLAVVDALDGFRVVHCESRLVRLRVPYLPGFLAFREAPVLLDLLEKMKKSGNCFYPQLLMVDGNGLLHPREYLADSQIFHTILSVVEWAYKSTSSNGFGFASHLGVLADLPCIGIGKNLHHVDGLSKSKVIQLLQAKENNSKDFITLQGSSGRIWGAAMRSTQNSLKPIFISVGHRISLDTSIKLVKMTCKYRVPEPIRQADIRSREFIRIHQKTLLSYDNYSDLIHFSGTFCIFKDLIELAEPDC